ncbi:MAG: EF-P lysine aminoacylase GenX [Desulfuromonadales bacterium]|nr:EF-P lysine aminoacylase GenX [Desulfuromonadales bacterium]
MTEPNWALASKQNNLMERARIVQAIRAFFVAHNFLEIETPQRIPANAPELQIDPLPSGKMWLQTSPELAMKRLLAAGYGNLFQICRVWRGGERGRNHLPEFTLLEWYRPGADYTSLMSDCEQLLQQLSPCEAIRYQGKIIDLKIPWPRLTVTEAFEQFASCSLSAALAANRFEEILTAEVEPQLGTDPIFLTEYPAELAALARLKPGDASCAERFELYIGGLEIANAFSELTDPAEQRQRFNADESARRAAGKPAIDLPEPFLTDLETMPEAAGIALGVDRLIMLFTDSLTIDQVVAITPEQL